MGKKAENEALRLVGLAYDTALGGRDWTEVLEPLAASVDAKSAILRMVDYTGGQVGFFDAVGIDHAYRQAYARHFMNIDIYRGLLETAPIGGVIRSNQIDGYKKTEFYNDYQKPQDMEHVCGSTLARNDDCTIQFGVQRSKRAKDFGQGEFDLLQAVLPHLVRAVQMRQLLGEASRQQALAEAALHQLRFGALLTDAQARPLFVNRMAEHHIIASNGALNLSFCGLKTKNPEDTARLCRFVAEAASTTFGNGLGAGGEMRIESKPGEGTTVTIILPTACGTVNAAPFS